MSTTSKALAEKKAEEAKQRRASLKLSKIYHLNRFPTIIQYLDKNGLRWDRNKKIEGVLIAWKNLITGEVCFGWSKCDKFDKFTKDEAFYLALQRSNPLPKAFSKELLGVNIPYNVKKASAEFIERAKKYFKVSL